MTPPPPAPIGLNDLGRLTPRGLAAFAARVAARAMPLYQPTDDDGRTAAGYFATAIGYAETVARGGTDPMPDEVLDELYQAADAVADTTGYAGFAAAHAARTAARTVRGAAGQTAILEVIASAFGATRVLYTAGGADAEPFIDAALRADFDALFAANLESTAAIEPSPTGPLGPLWPAGRPAWARDVSR